MLLALLVQGAEAGHAAGPSSPFEVNFGLFFWTWVVFIALVLVLKRFAFPALLKATEERERTIARQLQEAEAANAEAQRLLAENRRLLSEARAQAQAMVAEARAAAERERAAAVEKSRQEAERLLERARQEIAAEREKALVELRREAVDLSLAAATKLVGQRLDSEADRSLVMSYLSALEQSH
ncbi:MAG TPA: F0F1 ATP synthase subunit B [Gemmatimonadales bacterium]|jgi:F-type H+-transporting ATPase subunit b|nr:F0F1 ATP synthase subunit B [Gemmatimonadales bacterium]